MKRYTKLITSIAAVALMAACSNVSGPFGSDTMTEPDWDSAAADQIDQRISDAAERSTDANETLAQIERTRTAPTEPAMNNEDLENLPPELRRPTTVEWTGPGADLVGELARNIGYTYAVVGKEPPVDIMVSVSAVDEPAIKVFEDIGYQVAQFANVFVDPNGKRIEFRFTSNHQADSSAKPRKAPMSAPTFGKPEQTASAPKVKHHSKGSLGK